MQGRFRGVRACVAVVVAGAAFGAPQAASGAISDVFNGDVTCSVESDGVRFCGSTAPRSTTESFDGTPIDVNVAFPPEPASGPDGNYPTVMLFHGYGGGKFGLGAMQRWLDKGYATFSMTDRGFRESCGSALSRAVDPTGCADGYVRLIDNRYEVRDAQELVAELADEDLVDPQRLGATGGSYGGGMSMALATLRDRKVLEDGTYVPWTSPEGKGMQIAAATPTITWSDLAYSLAPNGSTLDYVHDAPYQGRFGVMKQSLVNGLYISGQAAPGFYSPEGTDPSADLTGWRNLLLAGEPYDGNPQAEQIRTELTTKHSSYYVDRSQAPAPLLMANGWTDDLFPVDEMVRFYNRTRGEYPDADLALFAGEIAGHPRSTGKDNVDEALGAAQEAWMDHYVLGVGAEPEQGVTAFTQTCPSDAPGGGPFKAANWARLAPGEVRLTSDEAKTIEPNAGDSAVSAEFNPVGGGGACASASGADIPGAATYRFDPAPAGGYTLMGSPTVIADFTLPGDTSQVAARLLDVAPDGTEQLVARGLWRPQSGGPSRQVFQAHPNGWTFAEGHVAKLELLPSDSNAGLVGAYGRPSDGQQAVTVADLELRLPLLERPGAHTGLVRAPRSKFLPEGHELAADFAELGYPRAKLVKRKLKAKGRKTKAKVKCPAAFEGCHDGKVVIEAKRKSRAGSAKKKRFVAAKGKFARIAGGQTKSVKLKLKRKAHRVLAKNGKLKAKAKVTSTETDGKARRGAKLIGKSRKR
jgi:predicted acyl esterase